MAAVSSSVEIDPVFIKALKLLHSKHPDSLEQLRALRDDVIRQHNQQAPTSSKVRDIRLQCHELAEDPNLEESENHISSIIS